MPQLHIRKIVMTLMCMFCALGLEILRCNRYPIAVIQDLKLKKTGSLIKKK